MRRILSGAAVAFVLMVVTILVVVTESSPRPETLTIQSSVTVFELAQDAPSDENLRLLLVLERVQVGQKVIILNAQSDPIAAFIIGSSSNNMYAIEISVKKVDFSGITFYVDGKPTEHLLYLLIEANQQDIFIDSFNNNQADIPEFGYLTYSVANLIGDISQGIWELYSIGQSCEAVHQQEQFMQLPKVEISCSYTIVISPDKVAYWITTVRSVE